MIPIRDEIRSRSTPHITWVLIIINAVIFFVPLLSNPSFFEKLIYSYGMIPAFILRGQQLHTLFTSMFLHANILHLIGNMLYLYIFGDNVEDAFGHGRYFFFYIACGLAASLTYIMSITDRVVLYYPTVGASGAISGVLGTYMVLYPKARILALVPYYLVYIVPVPAIFFLGFWFIFQFLTGMLDVRSGVAYWAHIGGFVAGLAVALLFRAIRKPPKPVSPFHNEV